MCDDDVHELTDDAISGASGGVSRRQLLGGLAGVPFAALGPHSSTLVRGSAPTAGVVRAALHVHSSFSEGSSSMRSYSSYGTMASMESQLATLRDLGADLCYFTDHDHRMAAETSGMEPRAFPDHEDFAAPHWTYRPETLQALNGSTTLGKAGLRAVVQSGASTGWSGVLADCLPTGRDYRATLSGVSLQISATTTAQGWAEIRLRTSYRPARAARPAGSYEIHYRLDPGADVRRVEARGIVAVVTLPHRPGRAATATVRPVEDLALAFPDLGLLAHDSGLFGLWLGAGSAPGTTGSATLHGLRLNRTLDGPRALALQRDILAELAGKTPGIHAAQGLEASYRDHLNIFAGGDVGLEFPRPVAGTSPAGYLRRMVARAQRQGAVCSFNHPFGAKAGQTTVSAQERARRLAAVSTELLRHRLYGAAILEVGYALRGGVNVRTHLDLWDILLTAGTRVYADGVSDDHGGSAASWRTSANRYFTDIIAARPHPDAVLPALRSGRSFVSYFGGFAGMLDLRTADAVMGGTQAVSGSRRLDVQVTADGIPSGGVLHLRQLAVDGMHRTAAPPLLWEKRFSPADLAGGSTGVTLDPHGNSYLRAEVRNATGDVVAFGNPLWFASA